MNLNFTKNKIFLYLFLFIFVFLISFIVTYVCVPIECDEVWLYGFCYNISKGMIIYRDFNVVTTPLYYFIGCLFLKVFGNYIISISIFNSILVSLIFLMMFRVINWKSFIVLPLILIFLPNGYNLFALFWLMSILILISKEKDNDFLVGFILGLLFITKQNIGTFLLIPYLYYSKNKFKGLVCFSIPFIIVSCYLILNNAFFEFIDYCFLGTFDFGAGNNYYNIFAFIELFILIILIICLIKSKFQDKELFYIVCFQGMMYPLAENYHFFVSFFPVMYYFVKKINSKHLLLILLFATWDFNITLFLSIDINIHRNDDILFLKNCGDLPSLMVAFKNYLGDSEYYYFTGYYGYLYKLYYDIPITKYDLWNEGNQGYKGIEKRIDEVDLICNNNDCLFIVDGDLENNEQSQVTKFYNYIISNHDYVEEFNTFDIYSNVTVNNDLK